MSPLDYLLFGIYPYICLAVFFIGSLVRFDRDQYTWKSDSSQMLRAGTLRWGSNLFHVGILFLFFGHLFGLFTPHAVYGIFISAESKQLLAVVAGGTVTRTYTIANTGAADLTLQAISIGGTHAADFTVALAPVFWTASFTVLKTGKPSTSVPPLPGVTPPTICVP